MIRRIAYLSMLLLVFSNLKIKASQDLRVNTPPAGFAAVSSMSYDGLDVKHLFYKDVATPAELNFYLEPVKLEEEDDETGSSRKHLDLQFTFVTVLYHTSQAILSDFTGRITTKPVSFGFKNSDALALISVFRI